MSTQNTINVDPGDGNGTGTYPPATSTPTAPASTGSGDTTGSGATTGSGTTGSGATPTPSPSPAPLPAATSRASSLSPSTMRVVDNAIIPLAAEPSQEFAVSLGQQPCRLSLYTRGQSLYLDLLMSDALRLDVPVARGVACLDRSPMILAPYSGFVGDLVFFDTQGASDPTWEGLGTRYLLAWLGA